MKIINIMLMSFFVLNSSLTLAVELVVHNITDNAHIRVVVGYKSLTGNIKYQEALLAPPKPYTPYSKHAFNTGIGTALESLTWYLTDDRTKNSTKYEALIPSSRTMTSPGKIEIRSQTYLINFNSKGIIEPTLEIGKLSKSVTDDFDMTFN